MKKNLAKAARLIDTSFETALERYFYEMGEEVPNNLYEMVIGRAERALFVSVMERAQGNQTQAAKMLGVSRTTLRNKLTAYKLM
ncbi:MAG: Fis family transcriptional regulator [Burkholderiales bacterium]|jgi:Fis family transcriptional regulator|nr:Fis family transcriptional regulator [Burkholderiales bacterium]